MTRARQPSDWNQTDSGPRGGTLEAALLGVSRMQNSPQRRDATEARPQTETGAMRAPATPTGWEAEAGGSQIQSRDLAGLYLKIKN